MNIIEAAKAIKEGKTVMDEMGFKHQAQGTGMLLIGENLEPANIYLNDILSEKWTVVDE